MHSDNSDRFSANVSVQAFELIYHLHVLYTSEKNRNHSTRALEGREIATETRLLMKNAGNTKLRNSLHWPPCYCAQFLITFTVDFPSFLG